MKKLSIVLISLIVSAAVAFPVLAAGWVEIKPIGWFYETNNSEPSSSRYAKNTWMWIPVSGNERLMYCYYFGPDGRMFASQTTPDGYQVDETGAWVVNGVRQWKLNENYKTPTIPVTPCPCPYTPPSPRRKSAQDLEQEIIINKSELRRREREILFDYGQKKYY